jgi:homocysteine S-methyltransferase
VPVASKGNFAKSLGQKFLISVELDPPQSLSAEKVLEKAKFLNEHGVDAVNIPDGPRAMARMSPMALGMLVREKAGIEPIVHYCCRDRNLLGMQMDLLGANALGLNNLLIITGDPPKMGTYPMATAVFDVDSIGLIHLVSELNHGVDLAGHKLGAVTKFLIGCGCNPGAVNIELEVERFRQKVEAGAEYAFSQPVYDVKLLERFFNLIKDVKKIPFFVGIFPLASLHTAEFVHNEVPGMQIPDETMERMRSAKSKEKQRETGLAIAKEALAAARKMSEVSGAYILPPFHEFKSILELLRVVF